MIACFHADEAVTSAYRYTHPPINFSPMRAAAESLNFMKADI